MRFGSLISTAAFALGAALSVAASAQSEEDVQYASLVLLCEARYEAKGTPDVTAFWTEQRGDLTSGEVSAAQRNMGAVSASLAQIDDRIVLKRCEELKSAIDDPDGYVDDRSPELQAASERVAGYVSRAGLELMK